MTHRAATQPGNNASSSMPPSSRALSSPIQYRAELTSPSESPPHFVVVISPPSTHPSHATHPRPPRSSAPPSTAPMPRRRFSFPKPSPRVRVTPRLLLLTTLPLTIPALFLAIHRLLSTPLRVDYAAIPTDLAVFADALAREERTLPSSRTSRVSTWSAPSCRGAWASEQARDSPLGFPYAVVRDASVDRRPRARAILENHAAAGATRIVLYVTTHLSARHTREGGVVAVGGGELVGEVEYVTWVNHRVVPKPQGRYTPGMKTKEGAETSAWQIGIRLEARNGSTEEAVARAVAGNVALNVSVPVIRYDEVPFPLHVSMQMSCVMGWTMPGLEGREDSCRNVDELGMMAKGSLLLSGSALYGSKKRDPEQLREVAHFAARGLMGPLRFDYVAMSVVSDVSVSDMELHCGGDEACRRRMGEVNEGLLRRIRDVVEEELDIIGVPRSLFPRLLLIPTCRLGSHSNGTERDDPCKIGKKYGQNHATFFSYAILAPYFKWAVSHDMDEYLSAVPLGWSIDSVPAEQVLDSADREMGRKGNLVFQGLDFRVKSLDDRRTLSKHLIRGDLPRLENRDNTTDLKHCYDESRVSTGKSALRCDVGLGFTIHNPVTEKVGFRMEIYEGDHRSPRLRTWHARLASLSSSCDYVPPEE